MNTALKAAQAKYLDGTPTASVPAMRACFPADCPSIPHRPHPSMANLHGDPSAAKAAPAQNRPFGQTIDRFRAALKLAKTSAGGMASRTTRTDNH